MTDTKTMERRHELPMNMSFPWPTPRWMDEWPSLRWLDDFFRDSTGHQMIKIEECTEGDALVIRAELPGIDPDKDVRVEIVDGSLLISAEKTETHEENKDHFHRSEFRYGSLTRSVPLPKGVDESKIAATYKDGILEVRMAMPGGATKGGARQIEVKRA